VEGGPALVAQGGPAEQHAPANPGPRQTELPVNAGPQGNQVIVDGKPVPHERHRPRAIQPGALQVKRSDDMRSGKHDRP
jgi:hypothetical protein